MKRFLLPSAVLLGTILSIAPASAQVQNPLQNPNQPNYQSNERSTTGDSTLGNFNPLQLIHNANFQRSRGSTEFQEDSQLNMNQAAEEFKRQQREQIQNRSDSPTRRGTE
jgi:hypothetical protein